MAGSRAGPLRSTSIHGWSGICSVVPLTARHASAALERELHELTDQAALADPGVTDQDDAARLRRPCRAQSLVQRRPLARATDERTEPVDPAPSKRAVVGHARAGGDAAPSVAAGLEDLLVELTRLDLRIYVQLVPEDADAEVILPERIPPAPQPGVDPDERAVDCLLQGIHGEEAHGRLRRRLGLPVRLLVCDQPCQSLDGALAHAFALRQEPFLERGLLRPETGEEVASIAGQGGHEIVGTATGEAALERDDVDVDPGGIERHRVAREA